MDINKKIDEYIKEGKSTKTYKHDSIVGVLKEQGKIIHATLKRHGVKDDDIKTSYYKGQLDLLEEIYQELQKI